MKKSSNYPHVLFILASFVTLVPNFAEYIVAFLILCWLLWGGKWWKRGQNCSEEHRVLADAVSAAVRPIHIGVMGFMLCSLLSALGAWYFSPFAPDFDDVARRLVHFSIKQCLLWFVLSGGMIAAVRRGWNHEGVALPFLCILCIYFVYCLLQRYTGVDLAHGFDAVLPPNRYSYGVFRVSGAMGHPLTLAYNLMLLTLAMVAILLRSNGELQKAQTKVVLLMTGVTIATLLLSGSRFPLVATIAVVLLCEWKLFWKYRYQVAAGACLLAAVLWIEGSIIDRFSEVFLKNAPLIQRFPRLSFWHVHLKMFIENPVFGVGVAGYDEAAVHYYNLVGYHDKIYTAHNIYLQNLADSGVFGFLGLTSLFSGLLVAAFRFGKSGVKQGLTFLIAGTLVSGLMQNNLRDSEFLYVFWFCASMLVVRATIAQISKNESTNQ